MDQAIAKGAPLRPEIKLSQALSEYQAVLTPEQFQSFEESPPEPNAVMALTCEIDRQNANRRTRRYGPRLTTFLNSVKGFIGVVDIIITSTGNPIAGSIWGAVKLAMQIASGFGAYFDSLSSLLMNLGLSAPRLEKYALLYPSAPSLQKELCNYYSVVVNLCTRVVLFVRKPFIRQFASAWRKPFDDEFGNFQKDLTRLSAAIKEEVSLASKQQQSLEATKAAGERKENSLFRATMSTFHRDVGKEISQARTHRENKQKSRFLRSCSTYNYETTLNQARKQGASTWIFGVNEYQQWMASHSTSTLLCSGIVGAGKTVLCANVVEDLVLNKPLGSSLAYFFCRSDDAVSLTAREVIGSLARQLLEQLPSRVFLEHHLENPGGHVHLDIQQIMSLVLCLLPQRKSYILVLDGLDECASEEIHKLVQSIRDLLESSKHTFKLFWTGRSDFVARLSGHLQPEFQVQLSASNNGPEISRFIKNALESALETNRLKIGDPRIILDIQDALEAGAEEMFLWVVFQMDTICAQNTDHDILYCLKDLPKGLPATFRRILRWLQDSAYANPILGRKIFEVVAAAQRPLTTNELSEAISITPGDTVWDRSKSINDVTKSLEACGSLIVIDEELSTVHFAHSSVKHHLVSVPTSVDVREYHFDPKTADINLGRIVVTYLNLDILCSQVAETQKAPRNLTADVPSAVIISALHRNDMVKQAALMILKRRKTPAIEPVLPLQKTTSHTRNDSTQARDLSYLLAYCQDYWLHHTQRLNLLESDHVYRLWILLVGGEVRTIELPWTPETYTDLGAKYVAWLKGERHLALVILAIRQQWANCSGALGEDRVTLLGQLLDLLPDESARPSLDPRPFTEDILQDAAARPQCEAVVRIIIEQGLVESSRREYMYSQALCASASCNTTTIARLLIDNGASANFNSYAHSSPLQKAVVYRSGYPMIRLLLSRGADVNATGGPYGTALTAAVVTRNAWALKLFLEAGADIDAAVHARGTAMKAVVARRREPNFIVFDAIVEDSVSVRAEISIMRGYEVVLRTLDTKDLL